MRQVVSLLAALALLAVLSWGLVVAMRGMGRIAARQAVISSLEADLR